MRAGSNQQNENSGEEPGGSDNSGIGLNCYLVGFFWFKSGEKLRFEIFKLVNAKWLFGEADFGCFVRLEILLMA